MDSEVKRKLRNIIFIYLFFILAGILILGVQKLKAYIEQVRFEREQKAYNFRSEGFLRYRLSKFVYAKLEFTNHKGEVFIIEEENDMKSIDAEEEEYIAGETDKFGSYRFIEGEYTQGRINNFNDNMKHIRLWNYAEEEYNTITETERITEFTDVKNINELWEYLSHEKVEGVSNMGALDTIGYDGTEQPTKIIYDYGNGKINIITKSGTLSLGILFENYLKDI
ncbi:hypothetical protein HMPREF9970_2402 [Lachnoanaerobaculum saburreum F0468]|uniref:Uncharacterized protein n=1 Tax=Lachnoanaerobaculum saburreum F0468 TaxID=1095750 RepID=I0R6Q2_9FIRM|nr:hypothetical protein [Lachnoanaerobaculum saburreum]EIC95360.1 hypothetical protein HMPREF9970_2402 [Lachnoanaerobaculum saburreum F0468]